MEGENAEGLELAVMEEEIADGTKTHNRQQQEYRRR